MYEVNLPSLKWFEVGNIYTGSLGTDPARGCLNTTTFNYRVNVMVGALCVQCWLQPPWNSPEKKSEVLREQFAATDSGINEVKSWLISKFSVSGIAIPPAPQEK